MLNHDLQKQDDMNKLNQKRLDGEREAVINTLRQEAVDKDRTLDAVVFKHNFESTD